MACRDSFGDDGDDDDNNCDDDYNMMYGVDLDDADRSLLGVPKHHLHDHDALDHVSYYSLPIVEFSPCDRLRHDILGLDTASFFRTAVQMVVALDLLPCAPLSPAAAQCDCRSYSQIFSLPLDLCWCFLRQNVMMYLRDEDAAISCYLACRFFV